MNNVGLVTGAANGIGYEFSKILASQGYNLLLIDINEKKLVQVKTELESAFDIHVQSITMNLAMPQAASEVYDWIKSNALEIEVLFNNAGFGNFGKFAETSWTKDEALLQLQVITTTHLTKLVVKDMIGRKRGKNIEQCFGSCFYARTHDVNLSCCQSLYAKFFTSACQ